MSPTSQPPPPAYTPAGSQQSPPKNVLRKHKSTFYISVHFIALLVVPWVLLCILDTRPLGGTSAPWTAINGTIGEDTTQASQNWYRALQTFSTLAAALTVPVLSVVLSHAAVVLVQRRNPKQRLNALELLALADAPWSRLSLGNGHSNFVVGALALILLGILQLILQAALVVPEQIQVATWLDVPEAHPPTGTSRDLRFENIGYDPNPSALGVVPLNMVVNQVAARMTADSEEGYQPNLWLDPAASNSDQIKWYESYYYNSLSQYLEGPIGDYYKFFTSVFPVNTNTGVLRYHATRLNSSISCEPIDLSKFPESCPGSRPFFGDTTLQDNGTDAIQLRWCVPGNYSSSPWTTSRSRQDISEELFVYSRVIKNRTSDGHYFGDSFAVHCSATTTRGLFELPNIHNTYQPGPLLDKWPEPAEIYANYNDRAGSRDTAPLENDTQDESYITWNYWSADPYSTSSQLTPGPLAVSMISMLGNTSWFHIIQNNTVLSDDTAAQTALLDICSHGTPFMNWEYSSGSGALFDSLRGTCSDINWYLQNGRSYPAAKTLVEMASEWFRAFNDTSSVNVTLSAAMFLANEATLTRAASTDYYGGRNIRYAVGTSVTKPGILLPAKIVISVLLGVEVIMILGLLMVIYRLPTFVTRINSITTAIIGAQLFSSGLSVPRLGLTDRKVLESLKDHDGLIGVNGGHHPAHEDGQEERVHNPSTSVNEIELAELHADERSPNAHLFDIPVGGLILGGRGAVMQRSTQRKTATNTRHA
ncbi:hypothetical protein SUNI508_02047 [Seiridium unicorne]|uniref:Uncharacterized protein n=1 Tax=Seiridium unicorne TaxID=138068 RepID=A0ABR2ULE5_9PEZI